MSKLSGTDSKSTLCCSFCGKAQREVRKPQVVAYFLWDWFDGSLFEFWK